MPTDFDNTFDIAFFLPCGCCYGLHSCSPGFDVSKIARKRERERVQKQHTDSIADMVAECVSLGGTFQKLSLTQIRANTRFTPMGCVCKKCERRNGQPDSETCPCDICNYARAYKHPYAVYD